MKLYLNKLCLSVVVSDLVADDDQSLKENHELHLHHSNNEYNIPLQEICQLRIQDPKPP